MWKCPVCDTDLDDSVSFCPIDGTRRVEHKSSPVEAATWTCRACHTENDGLYCKNCGRKRTPAPGSAPRPQQGGAAARPAYQWVCAKCNAVNPDTALTCMRCRAPRDYDENAALRKQLHSMEAKKNGARVGAILLICAVLLLFSVPYIVGEYGYTVYHNIGGVNGDVEKACSIVALLFAIFPIPFLIAKLDVRKRNLPFTISLVSAGAVGIYSCVIFFGSIDVNAVMLLITAAEALSAVFAYRYVKLLEAIENLLFHGGL